MQVILGRCPALHIYSYDATNTIAVKFIFVNGFTCSIIQFKAYAALLFGKNINFHIRTRWVGKYFDFLRAECIIVVDFIRLVSERLKKTIEIGRASCRERVDIWV